MINSVEEYEYVTGADVDEAHPHGDLDRIVIDGEIMPLRTGDTENFDKDGNAIPRANILRGEDVAFLMEAVLQRSGSNWLVEAYYYHWVYDTASGTWSREKQTIAGTTVKKNTFSRKISARNFGGRFGPNAKNGIADLIGGVCDNCTNGLSFEAKVFVVATDVERPSVDDFRTAYGFSGLPDGKRPYAALAKPNAAGPLSKDYLLALFQTLALCRYAYLGRALTSAAPKYSVNVDGDTGGYPTDFAIVGTDGDGMHRNSYATWGVIEERWSEWDKDAQESKIRESAVYCAVKTGFVFAEFRARHVQSASAVAVLGVSWNRYEGNAYVLSQKEVWLPVSLKENGSGVFRLASTGNFDTKQSVVSILGRCGWSRSSFPSDENNHSAGATITLLAVHVIGEWDDHTSFGA